MIRLFANASYDFIKWRRWAYGLTAAIIIPGLALFLVHGLNYSIEFTGGTLIQVETTQPVGTGKIRSALDAAGIRDAEIQQFGDPTDYVVRARVGRSAERAPRSRRGPRTAESRRSEEHTSELQSPDQLVCRLLRKNKTDLVCRILLASNN